MKKRKVLVIGNYADDCQISMNRFCELIVNIYNEEFETFVSKPSVFLGRIPCKIRFIRKYVAYIDKLIIYPLWLFIQSRKFDKIHIIDHGNSYYSFFCPRAHTIITCHDLLAIRGAFGDKSVYCESSIIGVWLQRLIIAGLKRAKYICFVSYSTYRDYNRIIGVKSKQVYKIIYNPINARFVSDVAKTDCSIDKTMMTHKKPYILMVGSSHPRKNRKISMKIIAYLGSNSPYNLVLVGKAISIEEQKIIDELQISEKIFSYVNPNHSILNYLYCNAHALMFPSYAEGFGWPIIEAQSSGCPVIASNRTSIPEIAGNGALLSDPDDVSKMSNYILFLEIQKIRERQIKFGTANIQRFSFDSISKSYIKVVRS